MGKRASEMVQIAPTEHLETLRRCRGYYDCPKDTTGRRLGPLVGYAGTYDGPNGEKLQWVGDVYYNFAAIERFHHVLDHFADLLGDVIVASVPVLPGYLIGAPFGGLAIAQRAAAKLDCQYVFFEKEIIELKTATQREQSRLVWGRHEMEPGSTGYLIEDVCNNFSTPEKVDKLVQGAGSTLTGIACEMNRSANTSWQNLSVYSILHVPTEQYRQDDPAVAADIAAGNVSWKPKDEWAAVFAHMEK